VYTSQSSSGPTDPHCRATLESARALIVKVFPIIYGSKLPEPGSRGCKDASSNEAEIRRWFGGNFKRNIAVRTGKISGVWVFDVDRIESLREFEAFFDKLPLTRQSTTGHGIHFWWRSPPIPVPNSVGRIWPRIDTRGENGYVLVPPSRHPDGQTYRWVNPDVPIAEAPSWLLARLRKPPPPDIPPRPNGSPAGSAGRVKAYAVVALNAECRILSAMAPNTGRNNQLNISAFSLGQLIGGGELERALVEHRLLEASMANGLAADDGMQSVLATIRSGIGAGLKLPRTRNGRAGR
jgi:hypothetical protein